MGGKEESFVTKIAHIYSLEGGRSLFEGGCFGPASFEEREKPRSFLGRSRSAHHGGRRKGRKEFTFFPLNKGKGKREGGVVLPFTGSLFHLIFYIEGGRGGRGRSVLRGGKIYLSWVQFQGKGTHLQFREGER